MVDVEIHQYRGVHMRAPSVEHVANLINAKQYDHVANILAQDVADAYQRTQNKPSMRWSTSLSCKSINKRLRSTAIGDVFVIYGTRYLATAYGFITMEEVTA